MLPVPTTRETVNQYKGQSNLATAGIAVNWGFRPPNLPFPWGLRPLCNTPLLGTTRVSLPNGISFCPTALAGCTSVTDDIPGTYRRTDHAMVTRVAVGETAVSDAAQ